MAECKDLLNTKINNLRNICSYKESNKTYWVCRCDCGKFTIRRQDKFDKITQKKILKEITYKYIPKEIMDRPKMGFVMPLKSWLRNDLKSYVVDNINEKSLKEIPIFRVKEMMFARNEFLKGSDHFYDLIWASLQFISWYRTWMKN